MMLRLLSLLIGATILTAFQVSSSWGLSSQQQQQNIKQMLDPSTVKKAIYSGRVYQHKNFLSEDQINIVLAEIAQFEEKGGFQRKGLSNTVSKNQTFDRKLDRTICPVPWFLDALEGKDTREIPSLLRKLQIHLSDVLERPTISDLSMAHECYYSKSEPGSRLPRHMDERHEELKASKGWLLPSRRSLSWLIYLSDPSDWDLERNGGALRTFPQRHAIESDSTHDGNLQIGWLVSDDDEAPSRPVYLDSWFPAVGIVADDTIAEPHCALYALDEQGKKQQLTRPYLTEHLQGMTMPDFLKAYAQNDSIARNSKEPPLPINSRVARQFSEPLLFIDSRVARQFSLLEDRKDWDEGKDPDGSEIVDIVPERGSLVVFDSVKLPHQVQLIHSGTRLALAGWFHEKTQEFPDTFYGMS